MRTLRLFAWSSACLCVCAAGAMALSPWRSIHLRVRSSVILSSVEGGLRLHVWTAPEEEYNMSPPWLRLGEPPSTYEFVWWWSSYREPGKWWWVMVPMLAVVPVCAAPMGVFIARGMLRRRRGRCVRCGYDLKGLQGGVGCPECGLARGRSGRG